jgi:hypothetical protein
MACWPANIVGAFFVALIIFDAIIGDYDYLIPHSVYGILATFAFWALCFLIGDKISGALLVVPSVVIFIFVFSIWFIGQSMKNRGYCMSRGKADKCISPNESKPKYSPPKPKCPPPKPKCPPKPKPKCPPVENS